MCEAVNRRPNPEQAGSKLVTGGDIPNFPMFGVFLLLARSVFT
jgi:hypothetical protein